MIDPATAKLFGEDLVEIANPFRRRIIDNETFDNTFYVENH